jgi:glucans biosynthesis protein
VLKADKVLAKQHEKQARKDAKDKEAKQPEAAPATPEPIKTEQVLTETWSYQLPADE